MAKAHSGLERVLEQALRSVERALESCDRTLVTREIGQVASVRRGVAFVEGLPTVQAQELVRFQNGLRGLAFDLDEDLLGVVVLDTHQQLRAGLQVYRSLEVLKVGVGELLLGRVVDPLGRPLDQRGPIDFAERRPMERDAPAMIERVPVDEPLQTGIKVVDALLPIGRGQRELILGDRQTGKTAIALDAMLYQRNSDVLCVYCGVGQRETAVARVIAKLREYQALEHTLVVVASGKSSPGLQYLAPYAATTMAEFFVDQGRDVLIVYDDLTRHARAYRELSLLLRRPPGREAYPGDIFYVHSRLLERSTHLEQGGSLTALPIIETQEQMISAYIPTNLISICDGQIYLSPDLFQKGVLPAVDVGQSVSRLGGKAQLPAYQQIVGDLRLAYSQFEELEDFARFGTRLQESTRRRLEHGRRVRAVLKQSQFEWRSAPEQIAILSAVAEGLLDDLSLDRIQEAEHAISRALMQEQAQLAERIRAGQRLSEQDRETLLALARKSLESVKEAAHGDA